jgi:hypothetical protein
LLKNTELSASITRNPSVNRIDDAKVKEGLAAQPERIRKTIQEMEASRKY